MVVDIRRADLRRNPDLQPYKRDNSAQIANAVRTAANFGGIPAGAIDKAERDEQAFANELRQSDVAENRAFVNQQNREFAAKEKEARFDAAKDVYEMETGLVQEISKLKAEYDGSEKPDITKKIDERHKELSQRYTKDKAFYTKKPFPICRKRRRCGC